MLRKIRIILAAVFFIGVTLLFLDFTGTLHAWLGWMAKIQFLPAVLAVNTLAVAALLLITILFGRVYCSVICPMGILQDIISWIHGRTNKKNRFRFRYTKARNWLRYPVLVLFIIGLALGASSLALLIAPYSAYGRIAANLFAPLYQWGNNLLAWVATKADSYAFYSVDVWIRSLPTFIIAAATFVIIFVLAWKGGRTYCNNICPVGTILGFFSRKSIFVPVIDTDKCRNCGLCGRQCKLGIDINVDELITSKSERSSCAQFYFSESMACLKTCINSLIIYDTEVLPWLFMETCCTRDCVTLKEDAFTCVVEVVYSQLNRSVKESKVNSDVSLCLNLPSDSIVHKQKVFDTCSESIACCARTDSLVECVTLCIECRTIEETRGTGVVITCTTI